MKPFWELANRICDDVLSLFRSRLLLFKAQTKLNLEYLIRNQRENLGGTRSRNNYAIATKEAFYRDLMKLSVCKVKEKRKLMLMGDFNGFVSFFHQKCDFVGDGFSPKGAYILGLGLK